MPLILHELAGDCRFTESPRWHKGQLWFVDVLSRHVLTMDEAGAGLRIRATVEGGPGGLGFMPDGTPIVVSSNDFRLMAIKPDGGLSFHADLSDLMRGAANDMLIDSHGRAYVGHYGYDVVGGGAPQSASLVMVEPNGKVREVADNLSFPNGMALTADGKTLIVAETFANQLTAFDVEPDGCLGNRRLWAPLPGLSPDGICLDPGGSVWVGCAYVGQFARVEEGGHIGERIGVPGKWAIACALGGQNMDQLFCATAQTSFEQFGRGESRGFVEVAKLGTDRPDRTQNPGAERVDANCD